MLAGFLPFCLGGGRDIVLTRLGGKSIGWSYDTEDTCLFSGLFNENCTVRALLSVTSPVKKEELTLEGTDGVICMSRSSISLFGANGSTVEYQEFFACNRDLYVEQLLSTLETLRSGFSGIDSESLLTFNTHLRATQTNTSKISTFSERKFYSEMLREVDS